jgi:hypothetical protein
MGDDWRVCITFGDLREVMYEQALTRELSSRLGYQLEVKLDDNRWSAH